MGTDDDGELFLECSDEEVYKETGAKKGDLVRGWRPKRAEDVVRLSEAVLASPDGVIPLSWQCPGKRPCTPNEDEEYETDEEGSSVKSASAASAAVGVQTPTRQTPTPRTKKPLPQRWTLTLTQMTTTPSNPARGRRRGSRCTRGSRGS